MRRPNVTEKWQQALTYGGPEDGTGGHTPQVKEQDDHFAVWDEDE
jgi:hypothetical protein